MGDTAFLGREGLEVKLLAASTDFAEFWERVDLLKIPASERSPYMAGFASSRRLVEAALRLRYQVFNLELGEGLESSSRTGLDEDGFDEQMTHLVLLERGSGKVVGTYRMQTMVQAFESELGSYTGQEFDLSPLEAILPVSTECGRACLALDHRNMRALTQLWLGIAEFMNLFDQQYLFGCCSVTSQDPRVGHLALDFLRRGRYLHEHYWVKTRDPYACVDLCGFTEERQAAGFRLPKLFRTYLRLGAKVLSEPALDREFGTIDFLVLIDAKQVKMSSLNVVT
jgi:putative hemolysin